jgi:hypothetical protein
MTFNHRIVELNGVNFTLGHTYRDSVLGIEGVAVASARYLTGCDQIQLASRDANGMPFSQWFDVTRIEGVMVEERPGGPGPDITMRHPA